MDDNTNGAGGGDAVTRLFALHERAHQLGAQGLQAQEMAVYDEIVSRFGADPDPLVREQVGDALLTKGGILAEAGRHAEALAVFDQLATTLRDGDEAWTSAGRPVQKALHELVCNGLYNKAVMLLRLGRGEEEVAAYDDVAAAYDRFVAAIPHPQMTLEAFDEYVMPALFNKALRLEELGRAESALTAYGDILARYDEVADRVEDHPLWAGREQVAWTLTYKVNLLEVSGQHEAAAAACDDLAARFRDVPELEDHVARTQQHKTTLLARLGPSAVGPSVTTAAAEPVEVRDVEPAAAPDVEPPAATADAEPVVTPHDESPSATDDVGPVATADVEPPPSSDADPVVAADVVRSVVPADDEPIEASGDEPPATTEVEPAVTADQPSVTTEVGPAVTADQPSVTEEADPPVADVAEPVVADAVERSASDEAVPPAVSDADPVVDDDVVPAEASVDAEPEVTADAEPEVTAGDEPEVTAGDEPVEVSGFEPPATDHVEPPPSDDAEPPVADEVEPAVVDDVEPAAAAADVESAVAAAAPVVTDEGEPAAVIDEPVVADEGDPAAVTDEPVMAGDDRGVQRAKALLARARRLDDVGWHQHELDLYDEVVGMLGDELVPPPGVEGHAAVRECVATALSNKAATLHQLGRHDEELAAHDETLRRFGEDPDPSVRELVARAHDRRAELTATLARGDVPVDGSTTTGEVDEKAVAAPVPPVDGLATPDEVDEKAEVAEVPPDDELATTGFGPDEVVGPNAGPREEPAVEETSQGPSPDADAEVVRAEELLGRAQQLDADGRHEEELAVYDEVIALLDDHPRPATSRLSFAAHFNKALTLHALDRADDELVHHDRLVAAYERLVAAEGITSCLDAVQALLQALLNKAVTLDALGRHAEELATLEEALTRYDQVADTVGDPTLAAGRDAAARCLYAKIVWLEHDGQPDAALSACQEMLARFADDPSQGVRIARTVVRQAALLTALDRAGDAIAAWDDLVTRFGDHHDPEVQELVVTALGGKAGALDDLGRHDEELTVYDETVRRFDGATEPALREAVARALIDKAITLSHNLDRVGDAFSVYAEVIARFGEDADAAACAAVVEALLNKAELLSMDERADDELAVYDEIVVRYDRLVSVIDEDDDPPPDLRDRAAASLHNKGNLLKEHDQLDRAVVAYEEVLVRFGSDPHPSVRQVVASAHQGRGQVLDELGRVDEAVMAFDDVVTLFADAPELELGQQVLQALVNKAATLASAERPDEAVLLYDDVGRQYSRLVAQIDEELDGAIDEQPAARVHDLAAAAVLNHAIALSALDRTDEELAAYDNLVAYHDGLAARYGGQVPEGVRQVTANALIYKADVLEQRDQVDAARATYEAVVARFGADEDETVQESVTEARQSLDDPATP